MTLLGLEYPIVTIRYRAAEVDHHIRLGTLATPIAMTGVEIHPPQPADAGNWRVLSVFLLGNPAWMPGTLVSRLILTFSTDVDIDYVALHN